MQVNSSRFGTFEVDDDRALTFERGLLGFPDSTNYVVVEVEDTPYVWLQSVDEEDVAFLATSPFLFFPDYDLVLSDDDQASLSVDDPSQVEVLALLTVHRSPNGETATGGETVNGGEAAEAEGDVPQAITVNLLGPVVVNTGNRQARQVVLDNPDYSTRVPLVA
jgi:flagellar assembly factor FliW